jgi:hypothetical protein
MIRIINLQAQQSPKPRRIYGHGREVMHEKSGLHNHVRRFSCFLEFDGFIGGLRSGNDQTVDIGEWV